MLKRRVLYIFWWLIIILYFFLHADVASTMLITFTVLLTAVSAVCAVVAFKQVAFSISGPEKIKTEEAGFVLVNMENKSCLPVISGNVLLTSKITGTDEENEKLNLGFYLGLKSKDSVEVEIKSNVNGELIITIDEIRIMDIFGVFCFKNKPDTDNVINIIVEPDGMREDITNEQELVSDSEEAKTEYKEEDSIEQVQE